MKAVEWYTESSKEGYPEAEFRLSRIYSSQGTFFDPIKAFTLCFSACQKGHVKAIYLIGTYYQSGIGTLIDLEKSERSFYEAAKLGEVGAMKRLKGSVYEKEFKKDERQCAVM